MSTDTPRTDAAACHVSVEKNGEILIWPTTEGGYVKSDFARELERENAKLREDVQTLIEIIDHANRGAWSNGITHPDGFGPDEGEVLMSQLFSPIYARYHKT